MSHRVFSNDSQHFVQRQQERGIREAEIDVALRYGSRYRVRDGSAYFLRWKDMPLWMPPEQQKRLHALVVIVAHCGTLITTYRDEKFLRDWKRRAV